MTPKEYAESIVKSTGLHSATADEMKLIIQLAYSDGMKADRWVNVSDRLPENYKEVLCSEGNRYYVGSQYSGAWADDRSVLCNPTRWQELPI